MTSSLTDTRQYPELRLVPDAELMPHRAEEMLHHTEGGPFNPTSVELPDIPTYKIHGTVEVVPNKPTEWSLEHNGEVGPLVFPFHSGFGAFKDTCDPYSNASAQLDMPVLTMESIRECDTSIWERLTDPHAVQVKAWEAVIDDLAAQTGIKLSGGKGGTKAIPVAHSMGGETALRYANRNPLTTEAVVLIATIGFGSPNILDIIKRLPKGIKPAITEEFIPFLQSDETEFSLDSLWNAIGYFTKNVPLTAGELASCLTSRLTGRTHDLRRQGVPTAYGQPEFDLLVQGAEGARKAVDVVGIIERTGHMGPQAKAARQAHWVRSVLDTLPLAKQAA